jgi:hypothetical protein
VSYLLHPTTTEDLMNDRTVRIIGTGQLGQAMAHGAARRPPRGHRQRPRPRVAGASLGAGRRSVGGTVAEAASRSSSSPSLGGAAGARGTDGAVGSSSTLNDFDPRDLDGKTSSEVCRPVGGAPVVKAANTLAAACSAPIREAGASGCFLSGDDCEAR